MEECSGPGTRGTWGSAGARGRPAPLRTKPLMKRRKKCGDRSAEEEEVRRCGDARAEEKEKVRDEVRDDVNVEVSDTIRGSGSERHNTS